MDNILYTLSRRKLLTNEGNPADFSTRRTIHLLMLQKRNRSCRTVFGYPAKLKVVFTENILNEPCDSRYEEVRKHLLVAMCMESSQAAIKASLKEKTYNVGVRMFAVPC
jgi:hypothetical protein